MASLASNNGDVVSVTAIGNDTIIEKNKQVVELEMEILKETIKKLRQEDEAKKIELLAIELALQQATLQLNNVEARALAVASGGNNTSISTDDYLKSLERGGYDYGFVGKSYGPEVSTVSPTGDSVPANAVVLAASNFKTELRSLIETFRPTSPNGDVGHDYSKPNRGHAHEIRHQFRQTLSALTLSNDAIWKREESRPAIAAPLVIKLPYLVLCLLLDKLFDRNPIERFFFLETVARMPYFSYITMLHSYETLGWWRRSTQAKRVHFAEEYNEYHHLLIMISLGGDQSWRVRFLAQHAAIVYFFVLIGLWICSPSLAYNFSELIEAHAVDTYAEFVDSNEAALKALPAPKIAKEYYEAPDLYVFDEFQTGRAKGSRRPVITNLYDVFCNIRDDEGEHVKTMAACQDPLSVVKSPNTEAALIRAGVVAALLAVISGSLSLNILEYSPSDEYMVDSLSEGSSNLESFYSSLQSIAAGLGFGLTKVMSESGDIVGDELSNSAMSIPTFAKQILESLTKYLR